MNSPVELVKFAETILLALQKTTALMGKFGAPIETWNHSLNAGVAALLDVASGIFSQLSLVAEDARPQGDVLFRQCDTLSIDYLREYVNYCLKLVEHWESDPSNGCPFDAMSVRAQTLRALIFESGMKTCG